MSAPATLTAELRAEVLALEDDLRARVDNLADVQRRWRAEYDDARAAERTSAAWEAWRDERVTLAAVAWVLTTVFVRFCEDNGLVKPLWITHAGSRGREATDAQAHFLREASRTNPDVTDREWLLEAVEHLKSLPATAGLVDDTSPMWLVAPSGDAAARLLNYWRERGDDGRLLRDLADSALDTRFLGDLYQDISDDAKKRYALLQTPVFVEEFILDRTLEPALAERPLEGFKAIDPTCGSGHFLLGIFSRLLDRWHTHAPGMDERERVQQALDAVHGVDLNPFAVAIARFRLTVAALQACRISSLEDAPAFKYHLAAGDSLLHGLEQEEFDLGAVMTADRVAGKFAYATENLVELRRILRNGQYDCVVGNPPYITVKDPALNRLYRDRYSTCHRQYALSVPFMERFFGLAASNVRPGWVGYITSNSFMKREFGVPLIQDFLPKQDLRYVIDSEGAWMPGHNMDGTPTVIMIGRHCAPSTEQVRVVLGKTRREGPQHEGGAGPYWRAIVDHLDDPTYDSEWATVADLARSILKRHPWSMTGGGVGKVREALDAAARTLDDLGVDVGRTTHTGGDDAYYGPASTFRTRRLASEVVPVILGDGVRDYLIDPEVSSVFPYDKRGEKRELPEASMRWFWRNRTVMKTALDFGQTRLERGLRWFDHSMFFPARFASPLSIATAFISSHNHFVLTEQGKVSNRSAPVLVLSREADTDDYLQLFALLNSSTVCFWQKQQAQPKGGAADHPWSRTYEFTSTTLRDLPIPSSLPLSRGHALQASAQALARSLPAAALARGTDPRHDLDAARAHYQRARSILVAQQEELDWETYWLYDLIDDDLTYQRADLPELALGERAFEIVLARKLRAGDEDTSWFDRHGSRPITEIPTHWPEDYRQLVERRIELVESHPYIKLLEKPEYKRRWATEPWEKQEERALRGWLLDRLEDRRFWLDSYARPTPKSIAVLADEVVRDADLVSMLALWEGRPDVPVTDSLTKLLAKEAVPYLAAYRYKESGLRKRAAWEHTWDLQRREDAGTYNPAPKDHGGDGPIPVPPKYTTADFARVEYWSHRGKLDVPKERFILYPDAGRETDPTPVLGWAGWDHAEQALAVATLIQERQSDGWADERLVPLVAGLAELLPWVQQWHDQPVDLYGGASPADFFAEQLDQRMAQVGATLETLRAWRPAPARRGRKKKA